LFFHSSDFRQWKFFYIVLVHFSALAAQLSWRSFVGKWG